MGSPTELAKSWDTLTDDDLQVIGMIVGNRKAAAVSRRMVDYLATGLQVEVKHREHLATKATQLPNWDLWTDRELSDGYLASVMVERACAAGAQTLQQWASLLLHTVCLEMSTRLTVRDLMKTGGDPCDN